MTHELRRSELVRSAPEAEGVASTAILSFIDAVEAQNLELHSVMLLRHGKVLAEGWWAPYAAQHPHMLFSLSKSFTATAAGLAIEEGRLSLDATVLSFFPDEAPAEPSANLAAMQVRHLLSMSTGNDQDTLQYLLSDTDGDWVRAFLARPVEHVPGTHFVYNSGATYMVAAIVTKVTGMGLVDYLQPRLFQPLGIADPTWETCPRGVAIGGWGLNIKTEDVARFGQLYLQNGMCEGTRLLPEWWVQAATAKQVSNGDNPDSDWNQGYGYQFWRSRHGAYRADGAFGQYCVVMPDQNAVLATTAGVGDMQAVLNLVWQHLLPAFQSESLPADEAGAEILRRRLANLALNHPQGQLTSACAGRVSGRVYRFEPNDEKFEAVTLNFNADGCEIRFQNVRGRHLISCGAENWQYGVTELDRSGPRLVAAVGAWTAPDTYTARLCYYETPFCATLTCRFADDRLYFNFRQNVTFGPARPLELIGIAT